LNCKEALTNHHSHSNQPQGCNLPRVWWCATGPLAFLPIHAAGIYTTDIIGEKISDYVISSYTPTVSALLQARRPPNPTPTTFKILAITQPQTPGYNPLPQTIKEVEKLQQSLRGLPLDKLEGSEGSTERVLKGMAEYPWVHFACHGAQDIQDPTESALLLADGKLNLATIVKQPLPHADFAFLSACQTAMGDTKLEEEAVHLAAGMLLAGYRSVIATMWAISDADGPVVAEAVYQVMLTDGQPDHTRAGEALHWAVQKLRQSGASFLSWLPFIHMGA